MQIEIISRGFISGFGTSSTFSWLQKRGIFSKTWGFKYSFIKANKTTKVYYQRAWDVAFYDRLMTSQKQPHILLQTYLKYFYRDVGMSLHLASIFSIAGISGIGVWLNLKIRRERALGSKWSNSIEFLHHFEKPSPNVFFLGFFFDVVQIWRTIAAFAVVRITLLFFFSTLSGSHHHWLNWFNYLCHPFIICFYFAFLTVKMVPFSFYIHYCRK